jgi:hypothetical protein
VEGKLVSRGGRTVPIVILAALLAGTAGAGEVEALVWWQPRAQPIAPAAPRPSAIEPVEGTLPASSRRVLRLLDHPSRVRPYLIALREFGLLRERGEGSTAAPVQVAANTAIIAGGTSDGLIPRTKESPAHSDPLAEDQ